MSQKFKCVKWNNSTILLCYKLFILSQKCMLRNYQKLLKGQIMVNYQRECHPISSSLQGNIIWQINAIISQLSCAYTKIKKNFLQNTWKGISQLTDQKFRGERTKTGLNENLTTMASRSSCTMDGPYGSVMGSACTTSPGLID